MQACKGKDLAERIRDFDFLPEVYMYPTPRRYRPLDNVQLDPLEWTPEVNVYVHVPFCHQFCSFCGYFKTIYKEELQSRFVDGLCQEIQIRSDCLRRSRIHTLHFGGGTPSLLSPAQLEQILKALQEVNPNLLKTAQEVSIEATPESIDREKFAAYRSLGVQRVSLGVQSLVDSEVALANRCLGQSGNALRLLEEAFESLRSVGISDLIIDLMLGIEGQTLASFETTLQRALPLQPTTFQLYALGLMPQTGLARRSPNLTMTGRDIYSGYQLARQMLLQTGYRQDSHDRYTLKPGSGFLQGDGNLRGMSLVGLGAGARSYSRHLHFRNTFAPVNGQKALETYLANVARGHHSIESGVLLDSDEKQRQYAIAHLLHLDLEGFEAEFGVPFEDRFGHLKRRLEQLGLVEQEGSILSLSEQGLLFRDLIAREFFSPISRELEEAYRN